MEKAKRFLFLFLTATLFVKMFVMDGKVPWQQKFELFSVPAQSMPFGDFRNVQTSAYCLRLGFEPYGRNACNAQSLPARSLYPDAHVPVLNYPPVWVRTFAWFDDGSERYFRLWGRLNACLLLVTVIWLSFRRNAWLAPVMLFSPPVLLCVERGNIDGMTFAMLFGGVSLVASRPLLRGLLLMAAAGMKLFPILAVGAWLDQRVFDKRFGIGLLLGSVLLIESALNNCLTRQPARPDSGSHRASGPARPERWPANGQQKASAGSAAGGCCARRRTAQHAAHHPMRP